MDIISFRKLKVKNRAVFEAISDMQRNVAELPAIQRGIGELKQDMKIVKAAVTDLSRQVQNHEHQIARLKTV